MAFTQTSAQKHSVLNIRKCHPKNHFVCLGRTNPVKCSWPRGTGYFREKNFQAGDAWPDTISNGYCR